jgi:hypothetical protein
LKANEREETLREVAELDADAHGLSRNVRRSSTRSRASARLSPSPT